MKKLNVLFVLFLVCSSLYGANNNSNLNKDEQLSKQEAELRYPGQDLVWTKEKKWILKANDTRTLEERIKEEQELYLNVKDAVLFHEARIYQERMDKLQDGVNRVCSACITASHYVLNKVGVVDRQNASGVPVSSEENKQDE